MIDAMVKVGGDRLLSYSDVGDPDGACVFFFHGAPASRLALVDLAETFAARGLRVVSPDRPCYGMSSPQPGRSLADWPSDVAALADALAIEHFAVAGHSSGGPYAVACAALLPERVSAALVIAGVTDMGWPGAWEGFFESEATLMRVRDARQGLAWCVERFGADGSRFGDAAGLALPAPDEEYLADPANAAAMAATLAEAFRQGVGGKELHIHAFIADHRFTRTGGSGKREVDDPAARLLKNAQQRAHLHRDAGFLEGLTDSGGAHILIGVNEARGK